MIYIDSYDFMFIAQIILTMMSLFIGYSFSDIIIGLGTPIWNNSVLILPYHESLLKFSFLPFYIKDLPLVFCFIGIFYYTIIFYKDDLSQFVLSYKSYYLPCSFNNNIYYLLICDIGFNAFYFNKLYILFL